MPVCGVRMSPHWYFHQLEGRSSFPVTSWSGCSSPPLAPFYWQALPVRWRMATGRRSRDGCGGGTLAMGNLSSKYLSSGSLGRPPLPPFASATILQACCVHLDSAVAPQAPANGASTSSVLSLLTGYQNQMPVVTSAGLPSFGASSPRRALDGGMRRLDVPHLVVSSA